MSDYDDIRWKLFESDDAKYRFMTIPEIKAKDDEIERLRCALAMIRRRVNNTDRFYDKLEDHISMLCDAALGKPE